MDISIGYLSVVLASSLMANAGLVTAIVLVQRNNEKNYKRLMAQLAAERLALAKRRAQS